MSLEYNDIGNTAKMCAEICLLEIKRAGSFPSRLYDDDGGYTKEAKEKLKELSEVFTAVLEESTK